MSVNQPPLDKELNLPGTAGPKAPAPAPGRDKANILLVDDRDDKRLAMHTVLAELGENVVQATSGKEALRCILQQDFAVILLDVNMPAMDGFETAFLIRQRKSCEHTPIIFVTGISDTETHVSRGYSLGAVDYILTPVLPEVLRTKVSVFVELFKKTEELKQQAARLREAHDDLEARVKERTAELGIANRSLKAEIAERERAELEIRDLNGELEKRVLHRTTELANANQELETFTYSVAHDLRAPLRQIHAYVQIIEEEFAPQIPLEAWQYLKRIGARSRELGGMVDDLLNLSRIAKLDFERQHVELAGVVEEVLSGLKTEAANRQIEWRIGELPVVACDPGLMKQVFCNLLSNAIKYTRPRETAVIEVGKLNGNDPLTIFVRDNGVGFSKDHTDKLFGVFQRLHTAEQFEGTGVGLAIVARIVQKHGGRIWAEGEVDKGAAFYFTLDQAKN